MALPKLTLVLITTTVLLVGWSPGLVRGSDWLEEPYGDDSFNVRAKFNTDVTLACNDSTDGLTDEYQFRYWIAPDLTVMNNSFHNSFWTMDGTAGWHVSDDGMELRAFLIQEAHFGFYYCVRERGSGDFRVIKKAINYKGPYWGDLWQKYETNTVIGLGASGGFLAICIMIGLTMHFQYHPKEEEGGRAMAKANGGFPGIEDYSAASPHSSTGSYAGYTNHAFEPLKGVGFEPVAAQDVHSIMGGSV